MAAGGTDRAGEKTGTLAAAGRSPRPGTVAVEFQLHAPGAAEIFLAGDFNDWECDSARYRLRRYRGDIWKKKVVLASGRHEYRFVVDGCWWTDPENPERVTNPYGTENSVVTVW